MSEIHQYKCPCCDGAIEFDSELQKMKCPYCGSEFEVETLKEYDEILKEETTDDMKWDTSAGSEWESGEADGLSVYSCSSCGGEIVCDETVGATECPFCGNPVIMMGKFSGSLKPDLVIPFKLDKKAAMEALKRHYKGKVLLPKVFKDENRIQEVKGIYVPFWLFNADANGYIRYRATKTRFWSDSNYNYTETRHYSVIRAGGLGFNNVPVDGSTKMDDILMESIEPYDISEAVDFRTAYLSGFFADKYDVDSDSSVNRANERIRQSTEDAFASTVIGYTTVTPVSTNISLSNGTARYALYPVWILNTKWNGKTYCFAMNGQTGKMVGDLPMDKKAFWSWLLGVAGVVSAVALALSYLFWLL
ncbi:MAG: hypothetical protein IJX58_03825 [Clostridia bacterium]|nr:hypothetical protein [Clostridia bacterium]